MTPAAAGLESDIKGTWVVLSETKAEFQVSSCSQECGAFVAGAKISFQRTFHQDAPPPPAADSAARAGIYSNKSDKTKVCLNVSANGSRLTSTGSSCGESSALRIDMRDSSSSLGGMCQLNITIDSDVVINNGSFVTHKSVSTPWFSGTFVVSGAFSGNTVSGTLSGHGDQIRGVCTGNWSATLQ